MTKEERTPPPRDVPPSEFDLEDDGFVPDIIKRAIQTGFRTVNWGSEKVGAVGSTLNTMRQEVVAVIGREIVHYLDQLNLTDEAVKVLTAISLEVKTEIRFIPNEKKLVKPDVKAAVTVKSAGGEKAGAKSKPKKKKAKRKGEAADG